MDLRPLAEQRPTNRSPPNLAQMISSLSSSGSNGLRRRMPQIFFMTRARQAIYAISPLRDLINTSHAYIIAAIRLRFVNDSAAIRRICCDILMRAKPFGVMKNEHVNSFFRTVKRSSHHDESLPNRNCHIRITLQKLSPNPQILLTGIGISTLNVCLLQLCASVVGCRRIRLHHYDIFW